MDTVIQHYKTFGKKLWVDFTAYDSIGKTMQKNGMNTDGTASSVLRLAHNEKTQTKAEIYAHLADRNGALLVPFAVDTHGSFSPMDTSHITCMGMARIETIIPRSQEKFWRQSSSELRGLHRLEGIHGCLEKKGLFFH